MMEPVSAVYITLNAAARLKESLAAVADFADEILIVDSGSSDDTLKIAREFGARVIHQEWQGFGAQKEFAVKNAKNDWVLCLDADEVLTVELAQNIQKFLENPTSQAARFARANVFLGRILRHGEGYPDFSLRLFHRKAAYWSEDIVHEKVFFTGTPATLKGDLIHHSADDLATYIKKQNRYTSLLAAAAVAEGVEPSAAKLILSPFVRFLKFYFLRQGFRDGVPGLIHILIGCTHSFLKHAKIWEAALKKSKKF